MQSVETLIIGAGQAGLAMSYHLSKRHRPHLLLEQHRIGERWRSERWDGLHFQSPNALVQLPGFGLPHTDPDAFATAAQIANFLEEYALRIAAPVQTGVAVTGLRQRDGDFVADTSDEPVAAANVVVATGPFQRPIVPALLPADSGIMQVHASAYRNPAQLPDGAVLVVGAGASGSQIAHELMRAGRQVYFSVGKHRRAPRRCRGHAHVWWWIETGMDQTPLAQRGLDRSPLVHSGAYGGQTIDFRQFAAEGMVLLGRAEAVHDGVMSFADDLLANLAHGDAAFPRLHGFRRCAYPADGHEPSGGPGRSAPGSRAAVPGAADTVSAFATGGDHLGDLGDRLRAGFRLDRGVPVLDARGMPVHRGGVTSVPGLYFLGLSFLSRLSSSFIFGVGADAERLAEHIAVDGNEPA